ncbi:MAG: DUF975 family protein [Clostridiales bacterium]|nr:DUF975 family protein [Candidatus Equinaster intestinalis]
MTRAEMKTRAKAQLGNGIFQENWLFAVLAVFIVGAITAIISLIPTVGSVVAVIVTGPIAYGSTKLFLKQARDGQKMDIGGLFDGFKDDFGGTFLISLMTYIFTFLWSLLFIIPGIIKTYSYSMAYYIKVDHPEYGWKECINESKKITNGHKMELFILDLSFIGWIFVGSLCLGIGTLWVAAYMEATRAQFYESIKEAPVVEA